MTALFTFFTKTPFYVWPLLAYLIFVGIKASKTGTAPLNLFLIMPGIFFAWSTYTIFNRYGVNPMVLVLWVEVIFLGSVVGIKIARRLRVRFDKKNKRIEVTGSWLTLILAMIIFWNKFFIGVISSIYPALVGTIILLVPELIAAFATGIFIGRSIGFFKQYENATHVDLA